MKILGVSFEGILKAKFIKAIKNPLLHLIIVCVWSPPTYSCSCDHSIEYGKTNGPIKSLGTGYRYINNRQLYFKFISCVNRVGCKDLLLSSVVSDRYEYDLLSYEQNYNQGQIETIYTHFNTFEEAINYDKNENSKRLELFHKRERESDLSDWCTCGPSKVESILIYTEENVRNFLLTNKKEFNPEFEGCLGCNDISNIQNIDTVKTDYNGKFLLKDNQLFFEARAQKDSKLIKVNQNFKCAPTLKYNLDQTIRLTTNSNFNINNDSIDEINLCKIRITPHLYSSPFSIYGDKGFLNKHFPHTNECRVPEFDSNFLKNAKTVITGYYGEGIHDQKKAYYLRTFDLLNDGKFNLIFIKDEKFINKLQSSKELFTLSFAIISADNIKINEANAIELNNFCNTVVLIEGFKDYELFNKAYYKIKRQARDNYEAKVREAEKKQTEEWFKEMEKKNKENAWQNLRPRNSGPGPLFYPAQMGPYKIENKSRRINVNND